MHPICTPVAFGRTISKQIILVNQALELKHPQAVLVLTVSTSKPLLKIGYLPSTPRGIMNISTSWLLRELCTQLFSSRTRANFD